MANKKRKPRQRTRPQPAGSPTTRPAGAEGANAERRRRKQEARQARERARKQQARNRAVRRGVAFLTVSAVAVGAFYLLNRAASPGDLSPEIKQLAASVGCSDIRTPATNPPANQHLAAGEDANYTERPATSGFHDLSTLGTEQKVFTEPVREEQAVHTLEHGGVIVYYRAEGTSAVEPDVIDRLAGVTEGRRAALVAPYPDFDENTSLAMVAWNTIMTCPSGVSAEDAETIATSFVDAFECTSRAPESGVSAECG